MEGEWMCARACVSDEGGGGDRGPRTRTRTRGSKWGGSGACGDPQEEGSGEGRVKGQSRGRGRSGGKGQPTLTFRGAPNSSAIAFTSGLTPAHLLSSAAGSEAAMLAHTDGLFALLGFGPLAHPAHTALVVRRARAARSSLL